MELRYTRHARERLREDEITEAEVEAVLEGDHEVFEQRDTIRYHAVVSGRALAVVIKRRTFPALVVTTFARTVDL